MARGKAKSTLLGIQGVVGHKDAPDWSFLYDASTIKDPNFDVGDRVVLPDGRAFRYGKCGATIADMKHGVKNWNLLVTELDAIAVAAAIGAKYVDITFADTDGVGNDGVIAVDSLRGGHISFYRGTDRQQRGIIGNTVRANGDTGNTRLYLDAALKVAINALDNVEVLANPYSDLRMGNDLQTSVMGMPCVLATTGQYFWIQTWGPCRVTPSQAELGTGAALRMYLFDAAGGVFGLRALIDASGITAENHGYQIAGHIIERTDGVAGSAAPFINLQINP